MLNNETISTQLTNKGKKRINKHLLEKKRKKRSIGTIYTLWHAAHFTQLCKNKNLIHITHANFWRLFSQT